MPPRVTVVNAPLPWRAGARGLHDRTTTRQSRPFIGLELTERMQVLIESIRTGFLEREKQPEITEDGSPNPKATPIRS